EAFGVVRPDQQEVLRLRRARLRIQRGAQGDAGNVGELALVEGEAARCRQAQHDQHDVERDEEPLGPRPATLHGVGTYQWPDHVPWHSSAKGPGGPDGAPVVAGPGERAL